MYTFYITWYEYNSLLQVTFLSFFSTKITVREKTRGTQYADVRSHARRSQAGFLSGELRATVFVAWRIHIWIYGCAVSIRPLRMLI